MTVTRDDQHVYRLGGKVIPGVTKVLDGTLRDLSKIPAYALQGARELGELVHKATELDARHELDDDSVDVTVWPYLRAWRQFVSELKPQILSSEEMVCNRAYGYAGTLDHRMIIHGSAGVLDKKTGVEDKADAVQLSAYEQAYRAENNEKGPLKRWILSLRADGKYRLREYEDYFHVFLAALTCYRFKNEG